MCWLHWQNIFRTNWIWKNTKFLTPQNKTLRVSQKWQLFLKDWHLQRGNVLFQFQKVLHLKLIQNLNEKCFVHNSFEEGLQAWNSNADIQQLFDFYKTVTLYVCLLSERYEGYDASYQRISWWKLIKFSNIESNY